MKKLSHISLLLICLAFITSIGYTANKDSKKPSPEYVLRMLKAGNDRFLSGKALYPHTSQARMKLAGLEDQGDYAFATVIACSDSRVPVELIFDAGIMDIFTIKVAGNVCDTDEIGSIEYGLSHVHTPVLVVLGHTQCGAVTAVTHELHGMNHQLELNIPPLVDNIIPAVKKAIQMHPDLHGDDIIPAAIKENVWQGIEDLFMRSPSTRTLVHKKKVLVIGAIYDVSNGKVNWLSLDKTNEILKSVEASPDKETSPYAK